MADEEEIATYGHCVGVARFMVTYVSEVTYAVHVLSKRLTKTTKADMGRLKHFGRYLVGVSEFAIFLPRSSKQDMNVNLDCYSDTDWAGDACDRRSVACGYIEADGCPIREYTKGQAVESLSSGEAEFYGGVSCSAPRASC